MSRPLQRRITGLIAAALVLAMGLGSAQAQTDPGAAPAGYYVAEDGAAAGPFPLDVLAERIAAGTLTRTSLVWTDGQADWERAGAVAALADLFPQGGDMAIEVPGFFLGRWVQTGAVPMPGGLEGTARITTEYRADETFILTGTIDMPLEPAALTVSGEGIWSVDRLGETAFDVTLSGVIQMGGRDKPMVRQLMNQTSRIEVEGQNTIRNPASGDVLRRVLE